MAIENLQIESKASIPPGIVVPWMGGYFDDGSNGSYTSVEDGSIGSANTFLDNYGWAVCDGSAKNDSDSHFFNGAGRYLPNLTDDRFLMGSTGNGSVGGSNVLTDHTHTDTISASHNISASQGQHRHYHDHASVATDYAGSHRHNNGVTQFGNPGSNDKQHYSAYQDSARSTPNAAWVSWAGNFRGYTDYSSTHAHSVNVPGIYSDYQTPSISVSGSVSISGSVGTGSAASSTENRPKYLTCLYIMKIK